MLVVVALVAVVAIVALVGRESPEPAPAEEKAHDELGPGVKSVVLCFADRDAGSSIIERREIVVPADRPGLAKKILEELIKGPEEEGIGVLPGGTRVHAVYFDGTGGVHVDFSSELVSGHPGGSSGELLTIRSVVRTVALNFPDTETVQFLVDGEAVESIAGHIDASGPFRTEDW